MTTQHWHGKAAVVTGAARGQGASFVQALLAQGAHVLAVDAATPDSADWQVLQQSTHELPGQLDVLAGDVATPACWDAVAHWLDVPGRVPWALVNNAGITGRRDTVTRTVLEDWERVLSVNLTGAMLGIRSVAPRMPRGGSIVNIGSTVGMTGYHAAAYSCSKWALRGLTRSAALELAPRGVRINCVCPGVIDTDMIRSNPALVQALQHIIPMQHMAGAHQIAQVVMFLLSDASSYLTGADLPVDGGITGGGIYWPVGLATGALNLGTGSALFESVPSSQPPLRRQS